MRRDVMFLSQSEGPNKSNLPTSAYEAITVHGVVKFGGEGKERVTGAWAIHHENVSTIDVCERWQTSKATNC